MPKSIQNILNNNVEKLKNRSTVKNEGHSWYKFTRALSKEKYEQGSDRLIVPYRAEKNRFAFISNVQHLSYTDTTILFPNFDDRMLLVSILGYLNSSVCNYLYQFIGKLTAKNSKEYVNAGVNRIPIKIFDLAAQKEIYKILWPYPEREQEAA